MGHGVVPPHRSPAWAPLTWSPPSAGGGGHHGPLRSSSGSARSPLLATLFRRGPPPSSSSGPASEDRLPQRAFLQSCVWCVFRDPRRGGNVPSRQSRSRRNRSTIRRTPPLPQRGVAQVCCAGGSGAGLRSVGEVKGPAGAHGLHVRHLGSRSHAPRPSEP
ncbi:hypothetical protein NDU88_005763 [Pleurodeles waltl]|uniref:Uncharacterized protein n=1 Tax=Pleurodeles waltl TaxID=8319 RepID=A0AAV7WEA9_PLEWA|nr:hypothetical protein NDU88_005763 [Pleurodeles waltl]